MRGHGADLGGEAREPDSFESLDELVKEFDIRIIEYEENPKNPRDDIRACVQAAQEAITGL